MARGFMGKILWVDLSGKTLQDEELDEKTARDFLGGYGLGAKIIFDRQKAGVDPLGPDAILGFTTGIITGTDALGGSRYTVVGKSPLTGGWGDANSGGNFGPYLRFAGYDAVFFTGISDKPVYLYIENGQAELKDAAAIWGKDSFETQDALVAAHGKGTEIACVGPSGEKAALIAAVMSNKGRAAGRSGLGAVMGVKKVKAIAVKGNMTVPVEDPAAMKELRKKHTARLGGPVGLLRDYGTPGLFNMLAKEDDAPTKNWAGVAEIDLPTYENLGGDPVIAQQERKYGCWRCPIACGGHMKASQAGSAYQWEAGAHKPEYETLAMFGTNCLNDNLDSIIKVNDICNRSGVDTISAGACIAFAIECYENGLITREDTGGLEMTWGNHAAIVAMTEKLCAREGFGDILADGVRKAAEKIGQGADKYAMHIGGQEVPGHDPRGGGQWSISYGADPTPARHTQGGESAPAGVMPKFDRQSFKGRGIPHKIGNNFNHVMSSIGSCLFITMTVPEVEDLLEDLRTISGWDITLDELLKTGERINNMRQAFNSREGVTLPFKYPDRMMGIPAKTVGPRAGITLDKDEVFTDYFKAMDWDINTGKPSRAKLEELGLDNAVKALYP